MVLLRRCAASCLLVLCDEAPPTSVVCLQLRAAMQPCSGDGRWLDWPRVPSTKGIPCEYTNDATCPSLVVVIQSITHLQTLLKVKSFHFPQHEERAPSVQFCDKPCR